MIGGGFRKAVAIATAAASIAMAVPAAAQSYSDGYKLLQAVEERNREEFDALVAKNRTVINARDLADGHTAMHIAVNRRDVIWLNYLANQGANPNIADKNGVTPLMRASQLGFYEGVGALVKAGAQVDIATDAGETPLISAVLRGDTEMMRILLQAGADPDRTDNSGRSARDYARIDGAGSATMTAIERNAKVAGDEAEAEVYGPSF